MIKFSARNLYLLLAFCITLLFTGTGVYYLFTNDSSDQLEKVTTQEIAQAEETPTPKPTQTPNPTPISTPQLKTTPSPTTEPTSTPEPRLKDELDSFMQNLDLSCYEACEYNYQCPANLECMQVGENKICANSKCKLDSTCTCNPTNLASETNKDGIGGEIAGIDDYLDEEELADYPEEYFGETENTTVGGIDEATPSATPKPTVTPRSTTTPTPKTIADLPQAGTMELTIALLLIGLSILSIGFTYLK